MKSILKPLIGILSLLFILSCAGSKKGISENQKNQIPDKAKIIKLTSTDNAEVLFKKIKIQFSKRHYNFVKLKPNNQPEYCSLPTEAMNAPKFCAIGTSKDNFSLGISVFVTETTNGSIAYISSKWFDRNEISSVKKRKRDYSSNQPSKYKETIWNKNSKSGKAFISVLEFVNNIENSKIEFE